LPVLKTSAPTHSGGQDYSSSICGNPDTHTHTHTHTRAVICSRKGPHSNSTQFIWVSQTF